ncbi:MAG: Fic family protein [Candidatus Omnitrophica bacterium]|nr:Fic family protein [Candidatus Omnitrophota bacterium]
MDLQNQYSILTKEFGEGFLLGVLTSLFVGYLFFAEQKRQSEKQQRELIIYLWSILGQGNDLQDKIEDVNQNIEQLKRHAKIKDGLKFYEKEFYRIDKQLQKSFKEDKKGEYVDSVLTYKRLADARADVAINEHEFMILNQNGTITIENIKHAHSKLFPSGYALAGKLRQEMVAILGNYQSRARGVNPNISSYTLNVADPSEIDTQFNSLVSKWNDNIKYIIDYDKKGISDELANFHHAFLLIHPFLDGNGRISRVILNEQASFLIHKKIKFKFDRVRYYDALHKADQGMVSFVSELIFNQL